MQTISNIKLNTQNIADITEVDATENQQIVQLPTPLFDMVGGGGANVNLG